MTTRRILFSGNANLKLATEIATHLKTQLGEILVSEFSDGESRIEILESVRGHDIFIVQSTSSPANTHLMELLLMSDALKRASSARITAVIPYFGYARQDKRIRFARVPITAKVVADLLATVGINRVLTVDLHADQMQGFFSMPVDNLYGSKVLLEDILKKGYDNPVIVSPDVGGVVRARDLAKHLNDADLAIIDKRRPKPNQVQVMNIIGEVKNRVCLIIDDMVDTAGTVTIAAETLKEKGAKKCIAYCTHPVLSGPALQNIQNSSLDELIVTNSIPLKPEAEKISKIRQLSLAPMLAEAIRRMSEEESLSSMFS